MIQLVATIVQLAFVAVVLCRLIVFERRQRELFWRIMALEERADAACLPSLQEAEAWNRAKAEMSPDVMDIPSSKT